MKEYTIKYQTRDSNMGATVLFAKDRDDAIKFVRRYYHAKRIVSARALRKKELVSENQDHRDNSEQLGQQNI